MFDPSKYTVAEARPLPVLLMLDVSASMFGVKIRALNEAVRKMLEVLSTEGTRESEIKVSIITFGAQVQRLFPFTRAGDVTFYDLTTKGETPLGMALRMAKDIIEDRDETPGRAYRPTVILVSDGKPTDHWEAPLAEFLAGERSQKCDRMAMAIGSDANQEVLGRFIAGTGHEVLEAHRAADIESFFKFVTMSVSTRVNSPDPDAVPSDLVEPVGSAPQPLPAQERSETTEVKTSGYFDDDDTF